MYRLSLLALVCVACGTDATSIAVDAPLTPDAARPDGPAPDGRVLGDSGTVPNVPDPGTAAMPEFWPDTEPNDTPEQAVPLGIAFGIGRQIGPYIGSATAGGHIGGGDVADYFVFRTGPDPGTTFIATACWDDTLGVNLLDFALYKVIDGQPLIPVDSSSNTDKDCERPQPFWNLSLEPDTKYLFAMIHVEGEGDYTA